MVLRDVIEILIYAILAIFGVAARELRYKEIKHLETAKLISSMVVAAFGAIIVYFISSMVTAMPPQMGYILAGLVGWGGPQVLDKLFEQQTGIQSEIKNDEKNNTRNKFKLKINEFINIKRILLFAAIIIAIAIIVIHVVYFNTA